MIAKEVRTIIVQSVTQKTTFVTTEHAPAYTPEEQAVIDQIPALTLKAEVEKVRSALHETYPTT